MKYLLIRVLRVVGIFIALLLILSLFLFTIVDRTNPLETLRYKENLSQIRNDSLIYSKGLDSINVGWSKVSITPSRVLPLAGYGARESNMFSSIHDSIFVRTLILEDGGSHAILVNLDLLIVPPRVVSNLHQNWILMFLTESFLQQLTRTPVLAHGSQVLLENCLQESMIPLWFFLWLIRLKNLSN